MGKPFMLVIYGSIAVVCALVMFGVALNQLTTNIGTVQNTVSMNLSPAQSWFPGLQSVMGVFGIVIFITLIGSGLAMIGGGAYGMIKGRG
jgi:hypothetical protein